MPKHEEIVDFLEEHLPYEVSMLRYAYRRINALTEGPDWNIHYSAFSVHSRTLVEFLTNDGAYKAVDLAKGYRPADKEPIKRTQQGLPWQTFHFGKRVRDKEGKVNSGDLKVLFDWIEDGMRNFSRTLDERYRPYWRPDAIPQWEVTTLHLEVAFDPSTTNHIVITRSIY